VLQLFRRIAARFRPYDGPSASARDVDAVDAVTAAKAREGINPFDPGMSGYPPGYVKSYDEGRPRK
jgi:5,10-methylenetetrahydrofolate reductase